MLSIMNTLFLTTAIQDTIDEKKVITVEKNNIIVQRSNTNVPTDVSTVH